MFHAARPNLEGSERRSRHDAARSTPQLHETRICASQRVNTQSDGFRFAGKISTVHVAEGTDALQPGSQLAQLGRYSINASRF